MKQPSNLKPITRNVKVVVKPYADKSILANFSLQWSQGKTDYDVVLTDGMQNAVQFLAKDLYYRL